MINFILDTLRAHPELAIFLALAIGYWVGALKFGSFSLGAVTGTLLAAVLIGQIGIDVSAQIKSIFFLMFLFAVGYGVGPQFVRGVAQDGAPQAIFAAVICFLCLGCVYLAATLAGYGPGYAAGLFAGSQTISASIGLATDAINGLGLPPDKTQAELDHIPVAYAICYLFGTIGTGWILAFLGPKMLGVDLAVECARYEKEMSGGQAKGAAQSAWHQQELRAYQVEPGSKIIGKTVAEAETIRHGQPLFIESMRRNDLIVDVTDDLVIQEGDVLAVSGAREALVSLSHIANEVEDPELLSIPAESVDIVVTNRSISGRDLDDLAGEKFARGVFLNGIRRGSFGVNIPVLPKTKLYAGDIVNVAGSSKHINLVSQHVGYVDRPTSVTDMVYVGLGIALGGLFGAIVIPIAGVPITLSTSGGALIFGLIFGWLRSFKPQLGYVPSSTVWFMNSVGLNVFIAVVGISAGPSFISGLRQAGIGIFFWGIFATSVPMLLAPFIGKYVFKFDPAINLGCCGGARTSTASVAMVGEVAKSDVPMLGYTIPYAVSNTLLTLWGMVIVLLVQ